MYQGWRMKFHDALASRWPSIAELIETVEDENKGSCWIDGKRRAEQPEANLLISVTILSTSRARRVISLSVLLP